MQVAHQHTSNSPEAGNGNTRHNKTLCDIRLVIRGAGSADKSRAC
jgi:hypothetical protein